MTMTNTLRNSLTNSLRSAFAAMMIAGGTTGIAAENPAPELKPNIVLIMSDDMGYSDIGCYGGEIQTPTLDRLAAGGLRLTQFYNMARCCPTRAALLTGLYPHQAGIGHMTSDYGLPQYQGELNLECRTLAEAVKPAGYRTYMCGKWHVTPYRGTREDPDRSNWPLQRGFDKFYGFLGGEILLHVFLHLTPHVLLDLLQSLVGHHGVAAPVDIKDRHI